MHFEELLDLSERLFEREAEDGKFGEGFAIYVSRGHRDNSVVIQV